MTKNNRSEWVLAFIFTCILYAYVSEPEPVNQVKSDNQTINQYKNN
jgi:hypothetical protein